MLSYWFPLTLKDYMFYFLLEAALCIGRFSSLDFYTSEYGGPAAYIDPTNDESIGLITSDGV